MGSVGDEQTIVGGPKPAILIVDDEAQFRRLLRAGIDLNGYEAIEAVSAREGLRLAAARQPELIVLDLGLPDGDGLDVLANLRQWSEVPIIILSVRGSDTEKVRAFEAGADDYMTKPFSMPELLARIKTALRRSARTVRGSVVFRVGGLKVDLANRVVAVDGKSVRLSRKQYRLLQILVTNAGKVVTQQQLLKEIWGEAHLNDSHYLRMFVRKLRNKIEPEPARPCYLITELGVGYRIRTPEQLA